MRQTFEYQGRTVELEVTAVGYGWQWSYLLSGTTLAEGIEDPLPSQERALALGYREACRHIERLTRSAVVSSL